MPTKSLKSSDGRYSFNMQGDGNLVLQKFQSALRCGLPAVMAQSGKRIIMQSDGNLVVYAHVIRLPPYGKQELRRIECSQSHHANGW
jgi:hypothetical protein